MALDRVDWHDLSEQVRDAVESRTGPVRQARTMSAGMNSAVAVLLDAADGRVFVKGLPVSHPGVVTQEREAVIAPHVAAVSPRLLWRERIDGWDLLGFEYIDGRHASYRPGSPDIPAVVDVMRRLSTVECPSLPELKSPARWREFVDAPSELDALNGSTLLHTDFNPENVLLDGAGRAHLIDWAWPTRGAAVIDPCVLISRLLAAGHTPASAESWVSGTPAWTSASGDAVDIFARASARMWAQIADADPAPWKRRISDVNSAWAESRRAASRR